MIYPRGISFFEDARQWLGAARFDVIFDVGANVGQSAHVFCNENPKAMVYCFEPVARAFKDLQRNVSHLPNVKTFQLAMGAARGEADIYVTKETALSSLKIKAADSVIERVSVSTLDDFCTQNGIEHIDLLKIDAEGYDVDVLQGGFTILSLDCVNFVQVEASFYHRNPRFIQIGRFVTLLDQLGYELFGIYDQMPHPTGRPSLAYMNAVFVNRKLLKEPPWK